MIKKVEKVFNMKICGKNFPADDLQVEKCMKLTSESIQIPKKPVCLPDYVQNEQSNLESFNEIIVKPTSYTNCQAIMDAYLISKESKFLKRSKNVDDAKKMEEVFSNEICEKNPSAKDLQVEECIKATIKSNRTRKKPEWLKDFI